MHVAQSMARNESNLFCSFSIMEASIEGKDGEAAGKVVIGGRATAADINGFCGIWVSALELKGLLHSGKMANLRGGHPVYLESDPLMDTGLVLGLRKESRGNEGETWKLSAYTKPMMR